MLFQAHDNLCSLSGRLDLCPVKKTPTAYLTSKYPFRMSFSYSFPPPPFIRFQLCTCVDESITLYNVCGSLCTPAGTGCPCSAGMHYIS